MSILIAAYNSVRYVPETLASVLGQTYDDWEVILADDASTDDTVAVAQSFGERIRVVKANMNSGRPSATRALALEHAGGELVAFLDADDLWTPSYLEELTELFDLQRRKDNRVAVAACDARLLLSDGTLARDTFATHAGSAEGLTVERLLISNPIYTSALVSRAVVAEAGGVAVDLVGTDDYDLWLRVLELGYRVAWTPEALAIYRVRPDSLSADLAEMAQNMQGAYARAIARGRLTRTQARLARRRLRIHKAAELWETLVDRRRDGAWPVAQALAAAPLLGRVAIENVVRTPAAVREIRRVGGPFSRAS